MKLIIGNLKYVGVALALLLLGAAGTLQAACPLCP